MDDELVQDLTERYNANAYPPYDPRISWSREW